MPNINGRICENNFREKSVLDQRPQQQQQRPSNLSPTHQAFFEAFPSRNSSDSIQTSNSLYYNNENFVHQRSLPLTPSTIYEHKNEYQPYHHPSQQPVYRNPSTKSSHYINENYFVNDGPLPTSNPALMYQRQKSAQSQHPQSFTPEYNNLQTNTSHFYNENSYIQERQLPSKQYEKQRENYGYQNIQQLLPSQISYRNSLPFEADSILKKPPIPLKPQKYQNFEQPRNQQKLLQREFNNSHPIENETFHQQRYHSLKYKIENYEYENQQQELPSYSSVHSNPKKHVSSSANFKTTSNGYRYPSESINNYFNGMPNSNKTNEPQIQQNNLNNFPTPTVYYSTEPQTLIPSKNTLNVPPKPPPRISSLKQSIVQKQNPPDFYNNFKSNQNSIEKPFSANSTTFNKSPQNGQKKLEKAIASNYFSDSADSGFNDAFATPTKEYNSPSQNSNDSIKTLTAATSNSDDKKEKEENEKPAFHKYFKVNSSPSIEKPFHSNAQGKNKNRFRERNVHPIFGSQNLSGVSRTGGFSSTVNDHLKFNPSPKNDNKYQQLDDNSKINIAPEAQKNSSAEKNSTQNGKTIVESGFEITVSDGKIFPKFENWKEMNLNQKLLENIQESNFQQPLNIHKSVIPYIQNRKFF
uniref:Uncharacterized protein n=1 Tax=Panagrolaimus davidi TaxID=227884 RepID=A0A914Q362_9BILA